MAQFQAPVADDTDTALEGSETTASDEYPKYLMTQGQAIIISNKFTETDSTKFRERKGADIDRDIMCKLFKGLNFEIVGGEKDYSYTAAEMETLFKEEKKKQHTSKICHVCVILSYGDEGCIFGSDEEKVDLDELLENLRKNASLAGSPKLCFIETCKPEYVETDNSEVIPETQVSNEVERRLPSEADFLKVHSCISESKSMRNNSEKPSWFIGAFRETLVNSNGGEDILTLMTRMLKKISKDHGVKKLPYVTSTLTKDFSFDSLKKNYSATS